MAKISIAGGAVVVTSVLKLEDIKKVAKYRPNALILKGGEDGKEPIFRIGFASRGFGKINEFGAEFAGETHDDAKLATITLTLAGADGDIREVVAEELGSCLVNLNKLEATIPAVLEEIDAEKNAVLDSITIV